MRRWTRTGILAVGCSLFILLGGILIIVAILRAGRTVGSFLDAASSLPAERRAAKQAGLLLGPTDLVSKTPLPESQNAAPLYAEITSRLKLRPAPKTAPDILSDIARGTATAAERSSGRALLATYAPELRLVERAAALPVCRFHRDWALGPELTFPEYAAVRIMARMLAARATFENEAGDPAKALRSVRVIAHMSRHVGTDPTLIAMLVQVALQAMGDKAWTAIVKANADKPRILRLAEQVDQDFGPTPDLRDHMRGDIVMGRVCLTRLREGKFQDRASSRDLTPASGLLFDAFEARYLAYIRRAFAIVDRSPQHDLMVAYRDMKRLADDEEAAEKRDPYSNMFNGILCPPYPGADLKLAHAEALHRLHATAIAIFEFRLRTGRLPDTLADLKSAPVDPFTNRPLPYRRSGNGFILYSVGDNLKDDGGQIEVRGKRPPLDIGIAYP